MSQIIKLNSGGSPSVPTTVLSVGMTTSQSVTQNALVDIIYDTVIADTSSGYSAGVYTIPTTGLYQCLFTSNWMSTAGFTNCDVFLNKNSGTFLYHGSSTATVSDPNTTIMNSGTVFPFVAGDTVKISVFAQTVGAANFLCSGFGNGFQNTFSLVLI